MGDVLNSKIIEPSKTFSSIYSTVKNAKKRFTDDLQNALTAMNSKEGKIKLSNGMEVDITTTAGMTVFSTYMGQLNAMMTFVDGTFDFVKKFEKNLQNLIGG